MCGRTRCTVRVDEVGRACGFSARLRNVDSDRYQPSYNVSPGRYMPVVRHVPVGGESTGESAKSDAVEPIVHCMKWGLVPSFTKKNEKPDHFRMFNARSESVHLKGSFRRLLPKSRCVAAVEGFYEWKKDGPKKQPYYVHFEDGRPLVFAGLYDSWKDEEDNTLFTFTILTTRSSKAMDWLHDRMPVILPNQDAISSWLGDTLQEDSIHKLTQPYEAHDLVWHPVTALMGKPSFDGPECIQEVHAKVASNSQIAQMFGKKQKGDSDVENNVPKENSVLKKDNVPSGNNVPKENSVLKKDNVPSANNVPKENSVLKKDNVPSGNNVSKENSVLKKDNVPSENNVPKENSVLKKDNMPSENNVPNENSVPKEDNVPKENNMPNDNYKTGAVEEREQTQQYPLSEDDRVALLAAMEPDPNSEETLEKVKADNQLVSDESKTSSQASEDVPVKVSAEKDSKVGDGDNVSEKKSTGTAFESSPRRESKNSPGTKRRRLSVSPKLADKKGGIHAPNDKQSSLLSFYGKE